MILRCLSNRGVVSSAGRDKTRARMSCRAICFDDQCQQAADIASLIAISVPIMVAAGAAWQVAKSSTWSSTPPQKAVEEGRVFEDKASGNILGSPQSEPPARDKNNEVVLRVMSYTPYPVASDFKGEHEGERVSIKVGNLRNKEKRTFVFPRLLPKSSIFTVELDRPLGVVLSWDEKRKVAFIDDFIEGSNGERQSKVAAMSPNKEQTDAPMIGDIVRGCTTATFTFKGAGALVGAASPERTIVVFCPDGKKSGQWSDLRNALKGQSRDGPVTLILERKIKGV